MTSSPSRPGRGRSLLLVGLVVLVLAVGAGLAAWWYTRPPDMVAVMHANNRGVGHMEQFDYTAAVQDFDEVVRRAPSWLPGRINLGIALLNTAADEKVAAQNLARAVELFQAILRQDATNPYAHFCLGIIFEHQGRAADAIPHFQAVTEKDPDDAASWFWLGKLYAQDMQDWEHATPCFQRAVQLDPYLNAAIYNLAMSPGEDLRQKTARLEEVEALRQALWYSPTGDSKQRYTEMGRYGDVISHVPLPPATPPRPLPLFLRQDNFQVQLAPGARWAGSEDLRRSADGELRALVRARFGGVQVVLDYNHDGKPDLLLLGAVVEEGQVRDLLLRNDGDGHFTDVTAEAGLGGARASLGCCVADFDNDGWPDLFLTGAGHVWLFRNKDGKGFEDVTAAAGLDGLHSVCLGATLVDLDQDGDLDLVVAQYAETPEQAVAALKGEAKPEAKGAGLAVYLNVGEAPAVAPSQDPPPLKPKFERFEKSPALLGPSVPAVSLAVADLDQDGDLDLVALADGNSPAMIVNDRLLRFHRAAFGESLRLDGRWNGALVLDANRDAHSDLFLVGPGQTPVLLFGQGSPGRTDSAQWFTRGDVDSPPLLQAVAIDVDLDGATDVIGLSDQHRPVLLHNLGGKLVQAREALGADAAWPKEGVVSVSVADFTSHGLPDLLVWSETAGLSLHVNQGNGNHGVQVEPTGHRRVDKAGMAVRCNADGVGVWVVAQAAEVWSGAENTTLSAGLGQSRQPLFLGLGRYGQPDVVRLRWPDNCWQAEFNIPGGLRVRIQESNRKVDSCPILFAWDGQRFGFVTDFLGAGSMGESEPGGGHRPPRPEESVKIEAEQLAPLHGQYVLKIAEPMNEVTYLDHLQLVVLDHPADVRVYPDERFASAEPPPSQGLLAFRQEVFPVQAHDHRGRDVTETLRRWDRDTVHDFATRTWLGFAEEHGVELDFGDRLAKFGPKDRLILCLAGWTDYPYPESIWAANQAGVTLQPPVLERRDADGRWQTVAETGFPAGLPRLMTLDVTGKLTGPSCVLRLRTNMQVYWDQVFVAPLLETVQPRQDGKGNGVVRAVCLDVSRAELSARGCMKEYSPDGQAPTIYDYDRLDAVPVTQPAGKLTRFGDVTELLRGLDDRYVLFGPGDELDVRFDAGKLPELPSGWKRSFVLRTWGYCKDCGPFTDTGATIEPLPFRAMRGYPCEPDEPYPHPEDRQRFHTRSLERSR